jgi:alpha/beta superfamily hydrolase
LKIERISIPCGVIIIEGELQLPDGQQRFPAAVVCHPHPLYGGDMDNNVVIAACEALIENSTAALRFNFRGVGMSGSGFGGGIKEQEDVKAAIDYLSARQNIDPDRIGLVGYSFGGSVAFSVAIKDGRIRKLALVSPAINDVGWEELRNYGGAKIVLVGDADNVILFTRVKKYFGANQDFQVVAGADHSWRGYESALSRIIGNFFRKPWDYSEPGF